MATTENSRAGVWISDADGESPVLGTDLPYHSRFETREGLFIDLRIPTRTGEAPQHSIEASCSGYCVPHADGMARHHTLSMQPPNLGSAEADSDDALEWSQVSKGCTAVLELLSVGPHSGLWIFSGGFFARITGLPRGEGLVGGYCCSDASSLGQIMGTAVDAELRGQYEAVLGRVERPGVLSVLRRSWAEATTASSSSTLYNGELGEGGLIEVDQESGLVVHHLLAGGEQRWRILSMDEDPFTPPGGARLLREADLLNVFKSKKADAPEKAGSSDEHSDDEKENKKDRRRRGSSSSASPSIVIFEDKGKKGSKEKGKKDKDRSKDKDKGKDRGRGRDRDRGSSSEDRTKKSKRKGDKSSSSEDVKKDKRRTFKEEKKKRSRSRKSSRSKSRKKKGKSRSRSKKKKDRSGSRSKKKKDKSRSRGRDKGKDKDKKDRRSPSKSASRKVIRKRLGGFDSRSAVSEALVPVAQHVAGMPQPTSVPASVPMVPSYMLTEANPEVEAFLAMNPVEGHAGARLRTLPINIARQVIHRGSLLGARDPAAVLNSRIRDAMAGGQVVLPMMPTMPMPGGNAMGGYSGVDTLIARYSIDAQCAQMLRALPLHLQALASELPMHEARNPSAFMMAQLQLPRFRQVPPPPGAPPMFSAV